LTDFYDRVRRFEQMRSKGYGFEADGTFGRSFYDRKSAQRRGLLLPTLVVLTLVFGLKGGLYNSVGGVSYQDRVERLQAGEGFDPVGGWLMQADPVTLWAAGKINMVIERFFYAGPSGRDEQAALLGGFCFGGQLRNEKGRPNWAACSVC
jgi:hypothetical protein